MIRRATKDDARALVALHHASIFGMCGSEYSDEQLYEWTAGFRPEVYEELADIRAMFVFEERGLLLGFGVCDPPNALINATYVHPSSARRGIGRELMRTMEQALEQTGATEVRLNATLNAVRFYESLGYRTCGSAMNRLPSGVELPCVTMSKKAAATG